jgi:putative membrane protein
MWYWGTGVHGWAWGLGILTSLIFWGLIIWAIVALVGWGRRGRAGGPGGPGGPGPGGPGPWPGEGRWRDSAPWPGDGPRADDAEQILSRRFAAGEIDAEEYRQRLEVLRSHRGGGPGPGRP